MWKVFVYIISLNLPCTCSYGQSLNGQWKGNNEHSIWILNSTSIILEIEVYKDSIITGVIHNYYKGNRFEHIKISGVINWKDSIVNIIEEEEISHNINTKLYETCLGKMQLKFFKKANLYYLKGEWKDKSRKLFRCPTLSIFFEKPVKDSIQLAQTDSLKIRKTDIQKVIELAPDEIDSIKCTLYDNGIIDDDTASVYFNDSLIIKKQRLSEHPIEFYISLDGPRRVQKIKLFADNLGTIPPNTALLIITTKNNHYVVTLSSDYAQNGSVEFFLKE